MYTSPSEPFPPPQPLKHSGIGIASTILAGLSMLLVCLVFVLAFSYGFALAAENPFAQVDVGSPIILALGLVLCSSPLLNLVGLGLGIAAVVQQDRSKLFGVIGLAANILMLCVVGALFLFGNL